MEHKEHEHEVEPQEVVIIEQPAPAATKERRGSDRFLAVSILIAAVLIGGSVVFATLYKGGAVGSGAGAAGNTAAANGGTDPGTGAPTVNTAAMTLGPRDAITGNTNAPVTIVEYGDYQCPFCAQFFSQTEPQIVSNYINKGNVRMVFRNFAFLGAESTAAAEAAECAEDQNQLWPYHDALYSAKVGDEENGGSENDGFFSRAEFLKLAQQVGLNIPTFTSCIDSNKYATEITKEKSDAQALGVDSTPTFFINGQEIEGAQPYSDFQSIIDPILKG